MFGDRCCVVFVNIYCSACVVTVGFAVFIWVGVLGLVGWKRLCWVFVCG